ncbi:MAG TPA: VOC family protein [Steroidobacteraceae bacterium]|nr:VOC family protein [Steroidobacteraceae bacterium]
MQRITPCLWFDNQAEEAVKFYVSLFRNSKLGKVTRYGASASQASGQPQGSVMTVSFQLDGQDFTALNGGPHFKFSEAISLVVNCETQQEVDDLWERLSKGGDVLDCGWVKDKYGLAWQIVPTVLFELLVDKDAAKTERVMQAMLGMKKLDIRELKRAAEGQG